MIWRVTCRRSPDEWKVYAGVIGQEDGMWQGSWLASWDLVIRNARAGQQISYSYLDDILYKGIQKYLI